MASSTRSSWTGHQPRLCLQTERRPSVGLGGSAQRRLLSLQLIHSSDSALCNVAPDVLIRPLSCCKTVPWMSTSQTFCTIAQDIPMTLIYCRY